MPFDALFGIASTAALASWICLILLPRWEWLLRLLQDGVVALLSLAYAVLALVYFFRVPGGGFGSIAEVRALFMSDPVLLAGWIHYLAFDLFVGLWIARQADAIGLHRLLQAPIFAATFMFGPVGFLLFSACRAARGMAPHRQEAA